MDSDLPEPVVCQMTPSRRSSATLELLAASGYPKEGDEIALESGS